MPFGDWEAPWTPSQNPNPSPEATSGFFDAIKLPEWNNPWHLQGQPTAQQWGMDQGLAAGNVQAGPQLAASQTYREQLAGQIGGVNASQSAQSGMLNTDYQTGLQRLGLSTESQSLERAANQRALPLANTLHDLANQSLNQQADASKRGATSSAIARGANTSIGFNQQLTDIQAQLANQLGASDARHQEQVASIADQNKVLDLQAKDLGLSRDALKTELERGLDRLGLSSTMSIADLTAKINSSNIEDMVIGQQIQNAALQASDYHAQFYPGPSTPAPEKRNRVGAS